MKVSQAQPIIEFINSKQLKKDDNFWYDLSGLRD